MKTKKQLMACTLSFALLLGMIPIAEVSAAKKVSLSTKKLTITKGKSKTLKVKNTKKKVTWKVVSGKKYISLKKKGKTAVIVKGVKKGTAKVQAKADKKNLTCTVTVKNPEKKDNSTKATNQPAPTVAPEPTDAPEEVEAVGVEREGGSDLVCPVKDVIEITKGFKTKLRLFRTTEVDNWTSSNPDVISIIKTEDSDYGSIVVVEAKKYGKSTLTAEHAGYTTKIILKSAKNQDACYSFPAYCYNRKNKKLFDINQFASVKYDKKGNIVVKFGEEITKWTKLGKKELRKDPKRHEVSNSIKMSIICNGKKVVKNYEKSVKKTKFLTLKKPKYTYTVIIPKKYIKKKNMDLRKCHYDVRLFYTWL